MPSGVYKHRLHTEVEKRNLSFKAKLQVHKKGHHLSEEHKKKLSLVKKGKPGLTKGKHWKLSEEQCKKWKEVALKNGNGKWMKGRTREKCANWRGGLSFEPYTTDWTQTLKKAIRQRDNYICRLCRSLQGDQAHCVHHINYIKKNCNSDNLITLCRPCHTKTNANRKYWQNYFTDLIKQIYE